MKGEEKRTNTNSNNIEDSIKIQEALALHFNSLYPFVVDRKMLFEGLFLAFSDKYNFEWPGDLWSTRLDFEEAKKVLDQFDFNVLQNKILMDEDIVPKEYLIQFKVRIKSKGLIWIIHKNDMDPFPSLPHAHQLDNNIKLDLSNGKCYKRRDYLYTLRRKDLLEIRRKAINKTKIELPPLEI